MYALFILFCNRTKHHAGKRDVLLEQLSNHSHKDVDSSLYFVRLLAASPASESSLQDLLHDAYAQTFLSMWDTMHDITDTQRIEIKKGKAVAYKILDGMIADTCKLLLKIIQPIYLWTKIVENKNNDKELIKLTNKFIATESTTSNTGFYGNRLPRYAFLIYQIISKRAALNKLSGQLFTTNFNQLKANQITGDSLTYEMLNKKVWYKYLYAYANYVKATEAKKQSNKKLEESYLKTAAAYSPDLTDQNHKTAYYYDNVFLTGREEITFQDDYLNFLSPDKDKSKALAVLLDMALAQPIYKEKLHSFYDANFNNQQKFSEFWISCINKKNKPVKDFTLKQINAGNFSTSANKGKWVLVDFWGTWCRPLQRRTS